MKEASCQEICVEEKELLKKDNSMPTFEVDEKYEADRRQHIQDMIKRSLKHVSDEKIKTRFKKSIEKAQDKFHHELINPEPMRVEPVKLKLKDNFVTQRQAIRPQPPAIREYINKRLAEYEKHGLVRKIGSTEWAQNIHAVRKGPDSYTMTLDDKWTQSHKKAWDATKVSIHNCMTLSFPNRNKIQYMWTDASENYWSAIITQIDPLESKSKYQTAWYEMMQDSFAIRMANFGYQYQKKHFCCDNPCIFQHIQASTEVTAGRWRRCNCFNM